MPAPRTAILLVDDEAKNLLALESILDSPDYELVKAQTADQALLALMERDYAAIVLDVQMPDISGLELARLIKQRRKTQHIPILFLTAYYHEDEHVVLGYGAGAVDYLTKPVNPTILRSKIGVFLDLFEKTRALADEVAEREKVEAALRLANEQLETKNAELEGQAEERAARIRAEAARGEAEAARERSAFLAEASQVFAASFNVQDTFQALAHLVVPRMADCCVVDLVRDDGSLYTAVVEHVESLAAQRILELRQRYPLHINDQALVPSVLRSGQPRVCRDFSVEEIAASYRTTEEARLVQECKIGSYIIVPLRARERTLGGLVIANATARNYTHTDVALAEELAQRVALSLDNARLYEDSRRAKETAEAANAAKDRFLAMLSHELRTPLSPVLHAVSWLEGERTLPESVREMLATIQRNVQLEARLIDDLLDLARIRNGKLQLHLEAVDAHDLIQRAVAICQPDIEQRQLKVQVQLSATHSTMRADPARLQQIVWNLISNAIKFTPVGGDLTLRTRNEGKADGLRVEVQDTGCGLPRERIAKIFDAFEQVDSHRSTGLGLGLAICKALVGLHGGRIEAQSEGPNLGSTFIVHLPTVRTEGRRSSEPRAGEGQPAPLPLRLLLVEDHPDTAAMLKRLLSRRGYAVQSAHSVAGALESAAAYEFDVLVSDIGLPDGSGMDLMQELITRHRERHFRGIALSGFGMSEDLERSRAAGFSEHLTKPVDFKILEQALLRVGGEMQRAGLVGPAKA